ncbi:MAG: hypothetical protein ACK47B_10825 [Armatimonadota bacterium]
MTATVTTELEELRDRAAYWAPTGAEEVWQQHGRIPDHELRRLLAAFLPPDERDALE